MSVLGDERCGSCLLCNALNQAFTPYGRDEWMGYLEISLPAESMQASADTDTDTDDG